MTVKEAFEKAILLSKEKRNDWVNVIKIKELDHCYLTNSGLDNDNISFTIFIRDSDISLITTLSDRMGISLNNTFIYANSIKICDMQTSEEFIITKDGIII